MENYKQKYEKALERCKKEFNFNNLAYSHEEIKQKLERIFPELEENEAERIRKYLIDGMRHLSAKSSFFTAEISKDKVIAWLEKQGEQKPVISDDALREGIVHFGITQYQITNWLKKYIDVENQGEQKPAWSEEDEEMTKCVLISLEFFENLGKDVTGHPHPNYFKVKHKIYPDSVRNWLKSLKDRVQPQPKQEWSEEEKARIDKIIDVLDWAEEKGHIRYSDWEDYVCYVKSLKPQNTTVTDEELAQAKKDAYNDALDKIEYHSGEPTFDDGWSAAIWYLKKKNAMPQNTWKPSDEQMKHLKTISVGWHPDLKDCQVLNSLYNDLKKLRKE